MTSKSAGIFLKCLCTLKSSVGFMKDKAKSHFKLQNFYSGAQEAVFNTRHTGGSDTLESLRTRDYSVLLLIF